MPDLTQTRPPIVVITRKFSGESDSLREHILEVHHDGVADLRPDDGAQVACPLRRRLLRHVGVVGVLLVQGLLEFVLKANTAGRQEARKYISESNIETRRIPPFLPPSSDEPERCGIRMSYLEVRKR